MIENAVPVVTKELTLFSTALTCIPSKTKIMCLSFRGQGRRFFSFVMGLLRTTSWCLKVQWSYFRLRPSSIRMTGLGGNFVWTMTSSHGAQHILWAPLRTGTSHTTVHLFSYSEEGEGERGDGGRGRRGKGGDGRGGDGRGGEGRGREGRGREGRGREGRGTGGANFF